MNVIYPGADPEGYIGHTHTGVCVGGGAVILGLYLLSQYFEGVRAPYSPPDPRLQPFYRSARINTIRPWGGGRYPVFLRMETVYIIIVG